VTQPTPAPDYLAEAATLARFMERINRTASGCWEWTSYRNYAGYGLFNTGGSPRRVHRLAYTHFIGPIPDGLQVDHVCRNRACCNPDHLEAVTPSVNTLRAVPYRSKPAPGRQGGGTPKPYCRNGHPRAGNIKRSKSGAVVCMECERIRDRRRYATSRNTQRSA
jgi:hypothetical protein